MELRLILFLGIFVSCGTDSCKEADIIVDGSMTRLVPMSGGEYLLIDVQELNSVEKPSYSLELSSLRHSDTSWVKVYGNDSLIKFKQGYCEIYLREESLSDLRFEYLNGENQVSRTMFHQPSSINDNVQDLPTLFAGKGYKFKVNRRAPRTSSGPSLYAIQEKSYYLATGPNYTFEYTPTMKSNSVQFYAEEMNPVTGETSRVWEKNYKIEELPIPELYKGARGEETIEIFTRGKMSDGFEYECPFIDVLSVEIISESGKRDAEWSLYNGRIELFGKLSEDNLIVIEGKILCRGDEVARDLLRVIK